jgi:hypothetical protein
MKNLFAFLCLFMSALGYSQTISTEAFFSASGSLSNSYAKVSWTLGDLQVLTYSSDNVVLTQGFLQSNLTVTNVLNIKDNSSIDLKVFPNPVSDFLNLKYTATKETSVSFYLYSLNGSLINSKKANSKNYSETIDFRQFQGGTYILKAVSQDGSFIRTFKLLFEK